MIKITVERCGLYFPGSSWSSIGGSVHPLAMMNGMSPSRKKIWLGLWKDLRGPRGRAAPAVCVIKYEYIHNGPWRPPVALSHFV